MQIKIVKWMVWFLCGQDSTKLQNVNQKRKNAHQECEFWDRVNRH